MSVDLTGVIYGDDAVLDGATVTAYDMTGAYVADDTSAGGGLYALSLAAGVYKLGVVAAGYPDAFYGGATFAAGAEIALVVDPVAVDVYLYTLAGRFSLNGQPLRVSSFSGFDLPTFASVVPLISDGVTLSNSALQSGSVPRRQADLGAALLTWADVQALRGYNAAKAPLYFADSLGDSLWVVVMDLTVSEHLSGSDQLWSYSMTLVEAA